MNDTPQARHEEAVRSAILLIMRGFENYDFSANAHWYVRETITRWAAARFPLMKPDVMSDALDRCIKCLGYTNEDDYLKALAPTAP